MGRTSGRTLRCSNHRGEDMKITVEHYGRIFTATIPEDTNLDDLRDIMNGLMRMMGYIWNETE
jgi:hypothetical protein